MCLQQGETVCSSTTTTTLPPRFTFTKIADSTGALQSFGAPSLNNVGAVAFRGNSGIFVGSGAALTLIADTSGPLADDFGLPSINDARMVAFRTTLDAGGTAIFTGNGGPLTTIVSTSDGTFAGLGPHVSINNSGTVAFGADTSTSQGVFTSSGVALL